MCSNGASPKQVVSEIFCRIPMLTNSGSIAVSKRYFAEGEKYLAFLMFEFDSVFIGSSLIAMASR